MAEKSSKGSGKLLKKDPLPVVETPEKKIIEAKILEDHHNNFEKSIEVEKPIEAEVEIMEVDPQDNDVILINNQT
ncbi:unnamed protein product [Diamesa serratosioi]